VSALLLHATFALGGGAGAVVRHALGRLVVHRFPLATLLINVLGSLILGAALTVTNDAVAAAGTVPQRLVIGFCGGFTTFSSFAVQSLALRETHSTTYLLANVALNLTLCLSAFLTGAWLSDALFGA